MNIQGMNPSLRSKSFFKLHMLRDEILKLTNNDIDVPFITVVETWLKPHINDTQICIENYTVYRADRNISKNGGALIYIRNDIIIDSTFSFDNDVCNAVVCFSKKSNVIIACIYRPPNSGVSTFSKLLEDVNTFLEEHNPINKLQLLIFGDFNFPQICWDDLSRNLTSEAETLLNFTDLHFLTQCVQEGTRQNNLLDLFFTNSPNLVNFVSVEDVCFSDHKLLQIDTNFFLSLSKTLVLNHKSCRVLISPFLILTQQILKL